MTPTTNGQRQQGGGTTSSGPPSMQGPTNNEYSYNVYADPNTVMQPVMQQQPPQTVAPPPKTAKKTGSKALTIINPATGKSIFDDDTTSSVNNDVGEKTADHHKEDSMEKENAEPLTPVVSAMSDGPSVDITPKHTNKIKKTKPPEIPQLADPPKPVVKVEQKVEVEVEIVVPVQVAAITPDTENNNGNLVNAVPIVEMTEIPQTKSVTPPPTPTPIAVVAVEAPQIVEFVPQPAVVIDSNDTNNNNYQKVEDEVEEIPEEIPEVDETDRAAVVEIPQDSNNNSTEADEKLGEGLINYDDDQWSPANLAGKKYYTRDQLLKLKDAIGIPQFKLPEGVANTLMKNNKEYLTNTLNQTMPPMGMRQPYDAINSVAPKFIMNQLGGRNPYPSGKRPSQTGTKQQVKFT